MITEGEAWSMLNQSTGQLHVDRQTSELDALMGEDDEQSEEYDRQIDLAEEEADDRATGEEAAVFQSERDGDSDWYGGDYWYDQRYDAMYHHIHGTDPDAHLRSTGA